MDKYLYDKDQDKLFVLFYKDEQLSSVDVVTKQQRSYHYHVDNNQIVGFFAGVSRKETPSDWLWNQRHNATPVKVVKEKGRGYSGGHFDADRLGWPVVKPDPAADCLLWWDSTRMGSFSGCYPETTSVVPE